jgi:hypothetical protein
VRLLLKNILLIGLVLLSTSFISFSTPSFAQGAKCDDLPKVEWWSGTHEKVIATVKRRYQGNWKKYISRWESYLGRMEKLHNAGATAVVKSRGLKIRGKQLANHITDINSRISVLNCLKKNQEVRNSKDEQFEKEIANFNTAAGGKTPQKFQAPEVQHNTTEVAAITGKQLDIEVTAKCDKDSALFQITNLGDKWPRLGEINIYRVKGNSLLSKRRVRMGNSQQATFRIRKRGGGSYGTVGIWVSPSWVKRAFAYDAKITCG